MADELQLVTFVCACGKTHRHLAEHGVGVGTGYRAEEPDYRSAGEVIYEGDEVECIEPEGYGQTKLRPGTIGKCIGKGKSQRNGAPAIHVKLGNGDDFWDDIICWRRKQEVVKGQN